MKFELKSSKKEKIADTSRKKSEETGGSGLVSQLEHPH